MQFDWEDILGMIQLTTEMVTKIDDVDDFITWVAFNDLMTLAPSFFDYDLRTFEAMSYEGRAAIERAIVSGDRGDVDVSLVRLWLQKWSPKFMEIMKAGRMADRAMYN